MAYRRSAESEYYAAAGALQESVFVQRLWNFLCNLEEQPICKQVDLTDARYSHQQGEPSALQLQLCGASSFFKKANSRPMQ